MYRSFLRHVRLATACQEWLMMEVDGGLLRAERKGAEEDRFAATDVVQYSAQYERH